MSQWVEFVWLLCKFIANVVTMAIFVGLAVGVLELRQTESFRRARAGWRAGRGKR
jgi:hypothetical protein